MVEMTCIIICVTIFSCVSAICITNCYVQTILRKEKNAKKFQELEDQVELQKNIKNIYLNGIGEDVRNLKNEFELLKSIITSQNNKQQNINENEKPF